ncbi:MAG: hypothetical protein IJO72_06510 [Oscillospiraceae bacterium]|nr:hypothetical protein [Oscillospiraceae bacterium]
MNTSTPKTLVHKLGLPFLVAIIGVIIMIVAIFLPYISATGTLAEYIELLDSTGYSELGVDVNPSMLSVKNVYSSVYSNDDGDIFFIIALVFCGAVALTALFVLLKNAIVTIVLNLVACGAFAVLNSAVQEDLLGANKYAWGIGYYAIIVGAIVIFAGAVWMLVEKNIAKQASVEIPTADTIAE